MQEPEVQRSKHGATGQHKHERWQYIGNAATDSKGPGQSDRIYESQAVVSSQGQADIEY